MTSKVERRLGSTVVSVLRVLGTGEFPVDYRQKMTIRLTKPEKRSSMNVHINMVKKNINVHNTFNIPSLLT